jgi:putative Mg2+ transporter-C (MgtC) family protein
MCELSNWIQKMAGQSDFLQNIMPMLAALVLGAAIGLEREIHRKPAGLRTNMLICMGAAMFTLISKHIGINTDAETRIIQGVVTGVGFLGAGVLIHQQGNVHGLTTAATIWLVTAVGIACGARLYGLSITASILAIIVLMGLTPIERKMRKTGNGNGENTDKNKDLNNLQ